VSDEELYAECDVVDFIEADAEKRAVIGAEFEPTDGPECEAMHIISPAKSIDASPITSFSEFNRSSDG